MEELGKVSGAMTSRIKGSVGDCVALCTIAYCIVQLEELIERVPVSTVQVSIRTVDCFVMLSCTLDLNVLEEVFRPFTEVKIAISHCKAYRVA